MKFTGQFPHCTGNLAVLREQVGPAIVHSSRIEVLRMSHLQPVNNLESTSLGNTVEW